MRGRWRLLALAAAVLLINAVTHAVVHENAVTSAYPSTGDSIAIPIYGTLLGSLIAIPWLVLIAFFSKIGAVRAYFSDGGLRSAVVTAALVVLYLPAFVLAITGIEYWAVPRHYEIVVAFAISLLVLSALAWDDFRTLRSNLALNTDARQVRPRAG
jgi:hypothetical protein